MTKNNIIIYMLVICFVFFLFSSRAFADVEKGEVQYIKDNGDPVYELTIDDNKEGLAQIDAFYNRKSGPTRSSSSGAAGAPVTVVTARPDESNYMNTTWYYSTDNSSIVGNHGTYSYYVSTTVQDALFGYYWYDSSHTSVSIVVLAPEATGNDRIYITGVKGSLGFIATNFTYSQTAEAYVSSTNITNGSDLILADSSIVDGLTIHDSYAAAVYALTSYDPTPRYGINYMLQPGHVVYIPVNGSYLFTLTGYFTDKSAVGSFNENNPLLDNRPWPYDNRVYRVIAGLPESSALPDDLNPVVWNRHGNLGLLGQTKEGFSSIGDPSYTGVGYLCIVNPTYNNNGDYNGNILITGVTFGQIYDYDLISYMDPLTGIETQIADVDNPYTAEVNQAGTVVTSDSEGNHPVNGGANYVPSADSVQEEEEKTLKDKITNFIETVESFITFPVRLIVSLVNSASEVINVLAGVFSWLPSEFSTMILTALGILVMLGVLKHFL